MDTRKGIPAYPFHYIAQACKILLLVLALLSFIFMLDRLKISNHFPIKKVTVYGIIHSDQQEIQELLVPLVKRGFFTTNVDYIRDRLLQLPWVADTFVRRSWPDKVEITVVEKKPLARWNNQSLLSSNGEVFSPKQTSYPADLPKFSGPDGKQVIMLQHFNKMNRLLAPLHVKIAHLELMPYDAWKLTLNNGINLQIGHKDILTRLGHFVKVYPKIIGDHAADVEYIDLRYPNGMAVRWKLMPKKAVSA